MKKNMGTTDRMLRTLAAIVLLILVLNGTISGVAGTVLAILAVVFLGTSALGFCPLYVPLKLSTLKKESTTPK